MTVDEQKGDMVAAIPSLWLPRASLDRLIRGLIDSGYRVVGPVISQGAVTLAEIHSAADLPRGVSDRQSPGLYRLDAESQSDEANFDYNVGPHSAKQFLFPPTETVSSAHRTDEGWSFSEPPMPSEKIAFLGLRACDLAAIAVQDRVFLEGPFIDRSYQARRNSCLIIAVNCSRAAPTCFCTSMKTGPRCRRGFDLALTELADGFVVDVGNETGRRIILPVTSVPVSTEQLNRADLQHAECERQVTKQLETDGLRDLLLQNLDHPQWDRAAERCLSCTNCTMVCPTCFCSSVQEVTDLDATDVERVRRWDSCFDIAFSYTAGGTVRNDRRSRYRQWLTHKLASWHDQFDSSGCVGCGRCITWCPVGIDLTAEVAAIRAEPDAVRQLPIIPTAPAKTIVPEAKP